MRCFCDAELSPSGTVGWEREHCRTALLHVPHLVEGMGAGRECTRKPKICWEHVFY